MDRSRNPILPLDDFTADVEARVYKGNDGVERLYLYGSHDLLGNETWCSHQYRVYSSPVTDLAEWTDYGVSFASRKGEGYLWNGEDSDGVSWSEERLYAPDVLRIDGRYWLVSCLSGGGLGMSVSDCPEGPFGPAVRMTYEDGEALGSIDPALYEEDGKVYMLWGQRKEFGAEGLVGVELAQNADGIYAIALRGTKTYPFGDQENPDRGFGFYEGISIRRVGGVYYVVYPLDKGAGLHTMSYATSKHPLGPYAFRGNILENDGCDLERGNNHGSMCEVNGEWYLFYHRGFGNSNMRRKVCAERLEFLADGRIQAAAMTNHGFGGPLCPYETIEAAYATRVRLEGFGSGCYFDEYEKGIHPLIRITEGCCVEYRDFDFGQKGGGLRFLAEIWPVEGGQILVLADAPDAVPEGVLEIGHESGAGWRWHEAGMGGIEGVRTIYLKFMGGCGGEICRLARFRFERQS